MEKLDVVNAALAALRAGETCELVVVAGTAGSSPRGVGAWMAVFADGSQAGTIGGGKIELFALDEARELLSAGQSRLVRYTMGGENSDTGMICGGAICLCYLRLVDYDENQKGADKSMLRKVAYYRERLLALADPSSSLSRYVTVRKYIDEKNFAQADFINRHSLSRMDPASHDYANLAYFQARICESLNRREEMKNWFIRSAMADIKTATKDNASLFSLADALFKDGDYARAFKYSSFSLEDAIAFDAKLRQWQISAILPAVQKSYTDIQQTHQKKTRNMLVAMYVLVFLHKSADGKLTAGPIWDFDWGVLSYNASPQARNGLVNRDSFWYARLFDDPDFKAAVKSRWNELLPQLKTIPAFIDEMEKTLQTSAELNFKMWDPAEDASQNGGVIVNGDERMTYNAAVERLKKIYEERLEIISKNL